MKFKFLVMKQYLKETVLGGIFFLIPLFVIVTVLFRLWQKFNSVGEKLAKVLGVDEIGGKIGGPIITTLLLLFVCFLFGLLAKWTLATRVRNRLDNYLQRVFPFYDYYRALFEQRLNGENDQGRKAVLIQTPYGQKPGILIEEKANGDKVVFVPFSPKTTDGEVLLVSSQNCRILDYDEEKLNKVLLSQGEGL